MSSNRLPITKWNVKKLGKILYLSLQTFYEFSMMRGENHQFQNFEDITSQYILIVVVIEHLAVDVRLVDVPGIVGGNSIP